MSIGGSDARITREELAWELAELFDELSIERVNEMLAKNVPLDTLRFIGTYADEFAEAHQVNGKARGLLPNLLLLGYLMRVVEDRLLDDDDEG